ncbi:FAD-dependent oxidoreductase [Deinococcus aestuarii]|uniref:FAD-dependent oxidoreductase n=1 Tax=Deinococcus aestuarii TaxID=2774531 RepID=UPI001C0BAE14|nr:FAD-dependent oxidoreductase [Deinococcus aestuarii]
MLFGEGDVCIVGGGPAGMILALLLARQGIAVTVLEAARDFERSFRGDTLHPAIMELLEGLGLAEPLLRLAHTRAHRARFITPARTQVIADFSCLRTPYPYLTVMAQARFLTFLAGELGRYGHARVVMGARVEGLLEEGGRVTGVRYRQGGTLHDLPARLTMGADGRFSKVRSLSGLTLRRLSPGQDVLWFALPRREDDPGGSIDLHLGGPHCIVTTDHGERWQVGYSIRKDSYGQAREHGVGPIRQAVAETIPWLADRVGLLTEWTQLHLLAVEVARVRRWWRPGLLLIGDAAHPISPIGGMGINMAVQDAVAAANVLSGPLRSGWVRPRHLARVQRERAWQIAVLQGQQVIQEREVVGIHTGAQLHVPTTLIRVLHGLPGLRRLPGYVTAYGLKPVRLHPRWAVERV